MPQPKASFNNHSIDLGTASLSARALCALVFFNVFSKADSGYC